MNTILSNPVIAIVIVIGLLVFIHETGHFLVGKLFGIGVEAFSIGVGPTLISFKRKNTVYRIAWLPLGGYVKFAGALHSEEIPSEFKGKEFYSASSFAQICTILAGPLSNLVLAVFVYAFLGMRGIEHPAPIIGQIRHDSPAAVAGLHSGDKVTKVNGDTIFSWTQLQDAISNAPDKKIDMEILRKNETQHISITPQGVMLEDMAGRMQKRGRIGIGYGFLSPVIELLPGKSVAREAGVVSGQEIKKVICNEKEFPIQNWDEFLEAMHFAYTHKASSLKIEFANNETKTLHTHVWKNTSLTDSSEIVKLLGITDSQFTIDSIEETPTPVLKSGDRLLAIEGKSFKDLYDMYEFLQKNEKENQKIDIQRGDKVLSLNVQFKGVDVQKASGKETLYLLPVSFRAKLVPPPPVIEKYENPFSAMVFATQTTQEQSLMLVKVIGGLFTGEVPLKSLGGPIMIAKVAEESAKLGLQTFLSSLALVSINLGILNLFPIPALDGGKLLMIGSEVVLRRKLHPSVIENYYKVGFVLLLALVVLATYNDLSRFWTSILQGLVGVFK